MLALSQALGLGVPSLWDEDSLCGKIICFLRELSFLNFQCQKPWESIYKLWLKKDEAIQIESHLELQFLFQTDYSTNKDLGLISTLDPSLSYLQEKLSAQSLNK